MVLKIEYYRKDSYGNTHYYIKDKRTASLIRDLLHKPTITKPEMDILAHIFPVEFVQVITPEKEIPI